MFEKSSYTGSLQDQYKLLYKQLKALVEDEKNVVANLSNASSLLNQFLHTTNWVGFYLMDEEKNELVLGPFQGLPACVRIPSGRGVCGTSVSEKKTMLVADVHEFPGHIACDAASQSEIVVPMLINGKVIGVLDIDSPVKDRFSEEEKQYLEKFVEILLPFVSEMK